MHVIMTACWRHVQTPARRIPSIGGGKWTCDPECNGDAVSIWQLLGQGESGLLIFFFLMVQPPCNLTTYGSRLHSQDYLGNTNRMEKEGKQETARILNWAGRDKREESVVRGGHGGGVTMFKTCHRKFSMDQLIWLKKRHPLHTQRHHIHIKTPRAHTKVPHTYTCI